VAKFHKEAKINSSCQQKVSSYERLATLCRFSCRNSARQASESSKTR